MSDEQQRRSTAGAGRGNGKGNNYRGGGREGRKSNDHRGGSGSQHRGGNPRGRPSHDRQERPRRSFDSHEGERRGRQTRPSNDPGSAGQQDEHRTSARRGGDIRAANRPDRERSPAIDPEVTGQELGKDTLRELRFLDEKHRDWVAKHLVMAGSLIEEDPELAFAHAEAASRRGSRVALVREAVGLTAYAAGKYAEALRELRTHRRISGVEDHVGMIADCERALGREQKALDTLRSAAAKALTGQPRAEAAMVEAGILLETGDPAGAVEALQIPTLDLNRAFSFSPRLFEIYADALDAAGRTDESGPWRARIPVARQALGLDEVDPDIFDLLPEDEQDMTDDEPGADRESQSTEQAKYQ